MMNQGIRSKLLSSNVYMLNLTRTKLKHNQQHSCGLWTDSAHIQQPNHSLSSDYFQASFKQPEMNYSKRNLGTSNLVVHA